ncbi:MAG: hypothetical protein WCO03_01040, partial [bacterium]
MLQAIKGFFRSLFAVDTAASAVLFLGLFLLPLFFIPAVGLPIEYGKKAILLLTVVVASILWLVK